ncbi:helix-turn-helix domain-containing protein [Halomonas sp.]|uniref:helix-turn-helix domain-containing protein n=1 Tax=Halomonas sp. TaxID=1486246 RepID=UPI00298E15BA|nr:helix-turn-helix domain-containing protein [Halomonas sp.]MDW7745862.1 helix-turn-helix domain-containing protein [Halomonas sp.]
MSTHCADPQRQGVDIIAVLDRLARLTGAQTDAALADVLGTSRQVLSGWRKRGTIPYEKLVEFAQSSEDVSLNYLLWGEEPRSIETPVEGNRVSAQKLEVIGDALLDAVNQVKAENGPDYEGFMKGPQIFAYAAIVYNRTIDQFPPGHIWTPALDREIEHIIEIVKLDYERQLTPSLRRDADSENGSGGAAAQGENRPSKGSGNQQVPDDQKSSSGAGGERAHQEIGGEGHQIAGGNIENNCGVSIGMRFKE